MANVATTSGRDAAEFATASRIVGTVSTESGAMAPMAFSNRSTVINADAASTSTAPGQRA